MPASWGNNKPHQANMGIISVLWSFKFWVLRCFKCCFCFWMNYNDLTASLRRHSKVWLVREIIPKWSVSGCIYCTNGYFDDDRQVNLGHMTNAGGNASLCAPVCLPVGSASEKEAGCSSRRVHVCVAWVNLGLPQKWGLPGPTPETANLIGKMITVMNQWI